MLIKKKVSQEHLETKLWCKESDLLYFQSWYSYTQYLDCSPPPPKSAYLVTAHL